MCVLLLQASLVPLKRAVHKVILVNLLNSYQIMNSCLLPNCGPKISLLIYMITPVGYS